MSIARCVEPLDEFAQWCGGTIVTFNGAAVAVTMPVGSSDAACWPGDYVLKDDEQTVRLDAVDASTVLPADVIELFASA